MGIIAGFGVIVEIIVFDTFIYGFEQDKTLFSVLAVLSLVASSALIGKMAWNEMQNSYLVRLRKEKDSVDQEEGIDFPDDEVEEYDIDDDGVCY